MARFSGRTALVTGASRGIGAGIAHRLAAEGADLALVARTLDAHPTLEGSLNETAELCRGFGVELAVIVADLADEEDRASVVPTAIEQLGPIDILVNNAAASINQPLLDFPLKRRRLTVEVNVHAPLDLAQAVAPAMVERGEGWIVNLSSRSAVDPDGPPYDLGGQRGIYGVYGASKAMLNRLSTAMAAEWHQFGIRVNTIEPRAAVLSEGALAVMGDRLSPDQIEPMESMVEATIALCDCSPDHTGRIESSLDLIERDGLTVRPLDGGKPQD